MQEQGFGIDMKDEEETQTRDSMKATASSHVSQLGVSEITGLGNFVVPQLRVRSLVIILRWTSVFLLNMS